MWSLSLVLIDCKTSWKYRSYFDSKSLWCTKEAWKNPYLKMDFKPIVFFENSTRATHLCYELQAPVVFWATSTTNCPHGVLLLFSKYPSGILFCARSDRWVSTKLPCLQYCSPLSSTGLAFRVAPVQFFSQKHYGPNFFFCVHVQR